MFYLVHRIPQQISSEAKVKKRANVFLLILTTILSIFPLEDRVISGWPASLWVLVTHDLWEWNAKALTPKPHATFLCSVLRRQGGYTYTCYFHRPCALTSVIHMWFSHWKSPCVYLAHQGNQKRACKSCPISPHHISHSNGALHSALIFAGTKKVNDMCARWIMFWFQWTNFREESTWNQLGKGKVAGG